ncbi:hypothetical protein JCM11251_004516 [Rhodosporidiobolus azoricus]
MSYSSRRNEPSKRSAPDASAPPCSKKIKTGEDVSSPTPRGNQLRLRWMPAIGARKTLHHAVYGNPLPSHKIAAFSLDHTIIQPADGARYCETAHDWRWWSAPSMKEEKEDDDQGSTVVNRLRALHADRYAIVIFTSQRHDSSEWWDAFKKLFKNVAEALDIPLRIFISRDFDIYRKPVPGAWMEFAKEWNGGKHIDLSESFYVGDAAGWGKSKLDYDRKFAFNIEVEFFAPSEFFLNRPQSKNWSFKGWSSREYDQKAPLYLPTNTPLVPRRLSEFDPLPPDYVLLVGAPGCGKTSFALKYLVKAGYVRLTDGSSTYLEKALCAKPACNFVIDTSLPSPSSRKSLITSLRLLAPKHTIRCFTFTASESLAKHNNVFSVLFDQEEAKKEGRQRTFTTESEYRRWHTEYHEPNKAEGFDALKRSNFVFDHDHPDSEERLKNWEKFLNCYPFEPEKT